MGVKINPAAILLPLSLALSWSGIRCECQPEPAALLPQKLSTSTTDWLADKDSFSFVVAGVEGRPGLQTGQPGSECPAFALAIRPDDDFGDRYHRPDSPGDDLLWFIAQDAKVLSQNPLVMDLRLVGPEGRADKHAELRATLGGQDFIDVDLTPQVPARDIALMQTCFLLQADEHVVGGGERFDGADLRGRMIPLAFAAPGPYDSYTNETHAPVPFATTSRGFSVLVESEQPGAIDLRDSDAGQGRMAFNFQGTSLPLRLRAGQGPRPMIDNAAAHARRMGLPPEPPLWSLAPMQWRNELYVDTDAQGQVTRSGQDRLLDDARQLRALDIPTTTLWIDAPWETGYNTFQFNTVQFPDVNAMFAELQELGFRSLVWATEHINDSDDSGQMTGMPSFASLDIFHEFKDRGYLVKGSSDGLFRFPWARGNGGSVDFTRAEAGRAYMDLARPIVSQGVRGFKLDYCEAMRPDILGQAINTVPRFFDGSGTDVQHTRFSRLYHQAFLDLLKDVWPDDHFIITRTGGIFDQANGMTIWPGDLEASFNRSRVVEDDGALSVGGLPAAVSAQQSLAMSAYPLFGSDIGGYRGDDPSAELMIRWSQFGALSPIMQLGGGGGGDEGHNPWNPIYGPDFVDIYRRYARLHMDLVPSLQSWISRASQQGWALTWPLGVYAPDEPGAWADKDSFVLGERLLVAPVVVDAARQRQVYFPAGDWIDWWTGALFHGGSEQTVDAPLDTLPLFQRAGSILWLGDPRLMTLVEAGDAAVVDPSALGDGKVLRLSPGPSDPGSQDPDEPSQNLADVAVLVDGSRASQVSSAGRLVLTVHNPSPRRVVVDLSLRADLGPADSANISVTVDGGSAQAPSDVGDADALWTCQAPCLLREPGRLRVAVQGQDLNIVFAD